MSYEAEKLQQIVEGALLAAGEALSIDKIHSLFEEHEAPEKEEIKDALTAIQENCEGRGFLLKEVASGWRFQVKEELATWVNRLWEEKPQKYSRALLETLALIAYRQPITRGDIEEVRGVAVSSHIIKTLAEREWVKVVGHRDVPGRPALYATTRQFLDYFNLKSLDELPSLGELRDIDEINASLDFEAAADGLQDSDEQTQTENTQNNESGEEPSADGEPSADKEPSADGEPSADKEPSASEEPSEEEHSANNESSTEEENIAVDESLADQHTYTIDSNENSAEETAEEQREDSFETVDSDGTGTAEETLAEQHTYDIENDDTFEDDVAEGIGESAFESAIESDANHTAPEEESKNQADVSDEQEAVVEGEGDGQPSSNG